LTEGTTSEEPVDPLLRAVAEHWDDIIRRADDEQAARLYALIDGAVASDPVQARAALGNELFDLLPPDHPVIRAMRTTTMYSTLTPDPGSRLAGALRWLRAQIGSGGQAVRSRPLDYADADDGDSTAELDEFDRHVRARLLSLPTLTAGEVRGNQIDPGDSGLIRLDGPDRQTRLPAFQFAPDGRPWPVVQEVNNRLGAAADPWGVTCWWVDPHQRLAASPQDLLGRDSDDLLRWAAAAVAEEWLCRTTSPRRTSLPSRGSANSRPDRSCGGSLGSRGRRPADRSPRS